MKGYVAQRRGRYYAVIYEGLDPVTGRERRTWHPAGTDRGDAEHLAARLATARNGRDDQVRSLSFGAYLTTQWLPAKRLQLAEVTYRGYENKATLHVVPAVGKIGLRRLRPEHLDRLYDALLHPSDTRRALAPKTVYEIHLVVRGALGDAVRRGLVNRNVAFQDAERSAVGIEHTGRMFTDPSGEAVHPHAVSQAFDWIVRRAGVPVIPLHGLRHTHGSLLIEAGVPVKVVSERLGHARQVFTIETYQHVMPGMQAAATSTFEGFMAPPVPPPTRSTGASRRNPRRKTA